MCAYLDVSCTQVGNVCIPYLRMFTSPRSASVCCGNTVRAARMPCAQWCSTELHLSPQLLRGSQNSAEPCSTNWQSNAAKALKCDDPPQCHLLCIACYAVHEQ
eukprot:jgi/Ulvmu1/6625/UM003_0263.1